MLAWETLGLQLPRRLMAVTDEDLPRNLGKLLQIGYSGQGGRTWNEWSFRHEELRVPSVYARSSTVDSLQRTPGGESRHEHCDNQWTLSQRMGVTARDQDRLFHVLVMQRLRGPALVQMITENHIG